MESPELVQELRQRLRRQRLATIARNHGDLLPAGRGDDSDGSSSCDSGGEDEDFVPEFELCEDTKSSESEADADPVTSAAAAQLVSDMLSEVLNFQPPVDSNDNVHPASSWTVRDFAVEMLKLQGKHNITRACIMDFCTCLQRCFVGFKLPESNT